MHVWHVGRFVGCYELIEAGLVKDTLDLSLELMVIV